jgi:hypothetical protein
VNEDTQPGADLYFVSHRRISLAVTATIVGAAVSAAATPATAHAASGYAHATRATTATGTPGDPSTNVPPTPDYWPACLASGAGSSTCINAVVNAIDNARALEGVKPMTLPSGFASMTVAVQTFVVSNLERVDRGLQPATGMVDTLNTLSKNASANDADPVLPPGWNPIGPFSPNRWGSNWAGDLNALAADYDWMYNDGWGPSGSSNLDCSSATGSGCWGHRHNILSTYGGNELITGVGSVVQSQWTSIAQIFVAGTGGYPTFTFSWSQVTAAAPTASPSTALPSSSADPTVLTATAPAAVVAGHAATVTGHLIDTVAGAAVPNAPIHVCHRAVTSASAACTTMTTDSAGMVRAVVHPVVTTLYWLVYDGSPLLASTMSNQVRVGVRPALALHATHRSTGWLVTAHVTPVRGQPVRLQRLSTAGWVTVRRTTAHSWMSFSRLRAGSYRVVVSAVTATLRSVGSVRAR